MKKYTYIILILALIQFITVTEMSIVMPLAPKIAEYYGVKASRVTFLNIGYALMGLLAPFIGYSADKKGIKKMLLGTVFLFIIGAFLTAHSQTAIQYFLSRSLIGLGYFTLTSLTIAYTSKIIPYERMGFVSGLYKLAFALSVFTSPMIGNFFVSRYSITELYNTIGISMLVIFLLALPLPKINPEPNVSSNEFKQLLKHKDVKMMILITFFTSIPAVYFYNYLSIYLTTSGHDQSFITLLYSFVALGTLLAAILILIFSDKVGKVRMTNIGFIFSTIVIIPIIFKAPLIMISFTFLFGLTYDTVWGLLFPVGSKMFVREANSFLTLLGMSMALANTFSSFTAPFINDFGGFLLNLLICTISLGTASILYWKVTKKYKEALD